MVKYPEQHDVARWPEMKVVFAEIFKGKTRAEWEKVFDGTDACVTPVLTPDEAAAYPHHVARGAFGELAGVVQPMAAPKFSRTPGVAGEPPVDVAGGLAALREWGLGEEEASFLGK